VAFAVVAVVSTACASGGAGPGASTRRHATSDETASSTTSPLVDPNEIVSGGPPPDGIPPIDEPKFQRPDEVDWLSPDEPVIAIELNGDSRAYPAQILIWHEIVNDTVGGFPVTVTYCPLCNTGVAFRRPTIDGQLLDFGTSGKLYKSNLVMYDRQTKSLWPQVTGQAVIGPLTGERLEFVPLQMVSWEDWQAQNPGGLVLSRDTGADRDYGYNPYEGYDQEDSPPFLFDGDPDPRLPPKARVVGVLVGDEAVAFPYSALRSRATGGWAAVVEPVGGRAVLVVWKAGTVSAVDQPLIAESSDVGSTGVFDPVVDERDLGFHATPHGVIDEETGSVWDIFGRAVEGPLTGRQLNRIVSIESFWFDWAAFHPDTEIFGGAQAPSGSAGESSAGSAPAGPGPLSQRRPRL
jgi:hypothetical protein